MAAEAGLSGTRRTTSAIWADREARIEGLADSQHGQVSFAQLRALGLGSSTIAERARNGRLHRTHPGVYSIGRPPKTAFEHRMAAVLACGERSALSYASAGSQLGIRQSSAILIDATSPSGRGRGIEGIRAHRSRTLAPCDVAMVDHIPTTSCARTLLDLAETIHPEALAKAFDQAEVLRILDLRALEDVINRNPGHHGLKPLRALLSSLDPLTKLTASDFERRLIPLLRQAGLPTPEVNADLYLEGRHVKPDFLWPSQRLVLETDGFETHGTQLAFERDRAKDALLLRHGYRVIRVTWRQLADEPGLVSATVRAGLAITAIPSPR